MKKAILLALAAVATIFTSCSSDIINDNDDSNNGQGKGITLIANVEQDDTRATLTTSDDTSGKWSFAFTNNDKVSVGNSTINDYYTFTNSGVTFSSADAKVTTSNADWYAYYPATTIDLTNQQGTKEYAATLYALAGATTTATTGADGLTINMKAQAAVLRIVKVDNYGPCDIFLKTKEGYVSGLKAKKDVAGFDVVTSTQKVSVFKKESNGNAGIYYVIVPAGVKIEVWNNDRCFKTTKDAGLTAGKYYTLTSGPIKGSATAKLANGTTMTVNWVQLYYGGPRFATENVAEEMSWNDAIKTGDKYIWGKYWRTVKKEELDFVEEDGMTPKKENIDLEFSTDNGVKHFKYKGIQPGYNSNEMIIPFTKKGEEAGVYWTSSTDGTNDKFDNPTGTSFTITDWYGNGLVNYFSPFARYTHYNVRPVLSQETVLWGEQEIK